MNILNLCIYKKIYNYTVLSNICVWRYGVKIEKYKPMLTLAFHGKLVTRLPAEMTAHVEACSAGCDKNPASAKECGFATLVKVNMIITDYDPDQHFSLPLINW